MKRSTRAGWDEASWKAVPLPQQAKPDTSDGHGQGTCRARTTFPSLHLNNISKRGPSPTNRTSAIRNSDNSHREERCWLGTPALKVLLSRGAMQRVRHHPRFPLWPRPSIPIRSHVLVSPIQPASANASYKLCYTSLSGFLCSKAYSSRY